MTQEGSAIMAKSTKLLFGEVVRQTRMAKGISQEELAFTCGLHRTYISDIERGNRNVSLDNIVKLAVGLDVSPKDLMNFNLDNLTLSKETLGDDKD